MHSPIISVENLSKKYRIGERARYSTLRDALMRLAGAPARLLARRRGAPGHSNLAALQPGNGFIWALKDVSLSVSCGEAFGLIGRNGAGKSTLLKILARITRPTQGRAELCGRVGSLLEVGTGFHNELTGRENIQLSGAILGMTRREIARKFDEIVDFSGVADFLDTPLKHFSTGMQMRLAFAVAAHLEPEILLVDEVLAVGDLEFQKKCLGKMEEVSHGGRTVLFVSHQMNQMRRLCQRAAWLDAGRIRRIGPAAEVIAAYESAMLERGRAGGSAEARTNAEFLEWRLLDAGGENGHTLSTLEPVSVQFDVLLRAAARRLHLGISLHTLDNQLVWAWAHSHLDLPAGRSELHFAFPMLPVKPGVYSWQLTLWDEHGCLDKWHAMPAMVVATPNHQHRLDEWNGLLNLPCEFEVKDSKVTV
jgi:lipopolysaccharide transport system ATP-binding protein